VVDCGFISGKMVSVLASTA